jgi:hypothetical protein
MNYIHSHTLKEDGTFIENKPTQVKEKVEYLKTKFGKLAIEVATEVLSAIEHEDNRLYYEIKFWTDVKNEL